LRDYEILYIVRPELDDDQLNQAVERVNALIANVGGEHVKTDVWGKRRLAYEVDRLREGYYVLTDFKVDAERVPEMESTLKISDTVFRHLIVRKPAKAAAVTEAATETAPAETTAGAAPAETPATDGEAPTAAGDEEAAAGAPAVAEAAATEAEPEAGPEASPGEAEEEG